MSAPTLFFVVSIIGLLFTLNALKPVPFEPLSIFAFFAGWLTSELPIHHLFWQLRRGRLRAAGRVLVPHRRGARAYFRVSDPAPLAAAVAAAVARRRRRA